MSLRIIIVSRIMIIILIRSIQQVIIVTDDLSNCIHRNYIEKRVITRVKWVKCVKWVTRV